MRFDLISIFPDYFSVLDLSLVGKAQENGKVTIAAHDLRDWAAGKHRSVDDTPSGGGAGMVMRADIWGEAIDSVLEPNGVLAIPTPAGTPLTQRGLERLATRPQIVVACGRYEGIDARVAQHYREAGVEVVEFSLGDYVLNGGEVAAIALVEGVTRLLDGVVGNPESLAEESHSEAGLLEYPVYTHPSTWRGHDTPAVLRSGDHQRIARWRRDESLRRTAGTRPDMIRYLAHQGTAFDKHDREVLATLGVNPLTGSQSLAYRTVDGEAAEDALLREVSALAGRTFALACPPSATEEEIAAFVSTQLTPEHFLHLLNNGARLTVVREGVQGPAIGYALTESAPPPELAESTGEGVYLSKLYVDPTWHGTGVAAGLLNACLEDAVSVWDKPQVVLGTNRQNRRALKFYKSHGFRKRGERTFDVGGRTHYDHVFVRDLTQFPLS